MTTLRDASERIDYGLTLSASSAPVGPKFLRITDIDGSHVNWDKVPYCNATAADTEKYGLANGDIVVARTGASTGRSQWIELDSQDAVFASYLVRFRIAPDFDSRFVSYVLQSNAWVAHVESVAHGKSAQPNMSAAAMSEFSFIAPSLSEQRAIVEVLGALDDKIAVNTKLAATADSLSKWTFRSVTKTELQPLSSLADFVNGKAFTKGASGTGRVVVRIAELRSGPSGSTVYSEIETDEKHVAQPGDILFAWSGSLMAQRWFRDDAIINQHIFKVVPRGDLPKWLVFELLRNKLPEYQSIAADKATTMGHIQRRHLDHRVPLPSADRIRAIDPLMNSLWMTALNAERENLALAETRDALLPQLMSGKLRVRDAEKVVSDAGV